jgi:hypothetical protein
MMFAFLTLTLGLTDMLSGVMSQISTVSTMAQSGGNANVGLPQSDNNFPEREALGPISDLIKFMEVYVDDYFHKAGILQVGDEFQSLYYPKFRRFFVLLVIGLTLVVVGIILKLLDNAVKFLRGDDEKGKKDKMKDKLKIRVSDRLDQRMPTRDIRDSIK